MLSTFSIVSVGSGTKFSTTIYVHNLGLFISFIHWGEGDFVDVGKCALNHAFICACAGPSGMGGGMDEDESSDEEYTLTVG